MEAFLGELVTYLIKYVIFIAIAVIGVVCGAKYKKNKIAKAALEGEAADTASEE